LDEMVEFVKWPKYEEYKEMFKEDFIMDRRDAGGNGEAEPTAEARDGDSDPPISLGSRRGY
jgi:hypothetical protein